MKDYTSFEDGFGKYWLIQIWKHTTALSNLPPKVHSSIFSVIE